ncbi:Lysine-specific demethylase 8, partial [Nowakowskiella sp. JEL0078]
MPYTKVSLSSHVLYTRSAILMSLSILAELRFEDQQSGGAFHNILNDTVVCIGNDPGKKRKTFDDNVNRSNKRVPLQLESVDCKEYIEQSSTDKMKIILDRNKIFECVKESIRILDTALIMCGCPGYKPLVFILIEFFEKIAFTLGPSINARTLSLDYHQNLELKHPVKILNEPLSMNEFSRLLKNPFPVVIRNAISQWPALSTRPWNDTSYLQKAIGVYRYVPIELGSKYTDDSWTQKIVSVQEFLKSSGFLQSDDLNENPPVVYLAQYDLFGQIPRLRDDVSIPEYCYAIGLDSESDNDLDDEVVLNSWIGPKDTVSPLHTDPKHNIFAQVVGKKYVRLYSPLETGNLYCHGNGTLLGNTSQVDLEAVDHKKFPKFNQAIYVEHIVEPGDLLFIPAMSTKESRIKPYSYHHLSQPHPASSPSNASGTSESRPQESCTSSASTLPSHPHSTTRGFSAPTPLAQLAKFKKPAKYSSVNLPNYSLKLAGTDRRKLDRILPQQPTNTENTDSPNLHYHGILPKSVWFIISNEFSERFCFYGLVPLLRVFCIHTFGYSELTANQAVHFFKAAVFIFPLLGSAMSDIFFTKYRTIIILTILYVLGMTVVTVSSMPGVFGIPPKVQDWSTILGLTLVAIGTGGLKPCISSHGNEQFLATQRPNLHKFYHFFYLAINLGAVSSGIFIPAIHNYSCFGYPRDCYTVSFATCTIILLSGLIIFFCGRRFYRELPPSGIFFPFTLLRAASSFAISTISTGSTSKATQIFEEQFEPHVMEELKQLLKVLVVLSPSPIFWSSFDQITTTWQQQGEQLNSTFSLDAYQMSAVMNPLLICVLAPILSNLVYPAVERCWSSLTIESKVDDIESNFEYPINLSAIANADQPLKQLFTLPESVKAKASRFDVIKYPLRLDTNTMPARTPLPSLVYHPPSSLTLIYRMVAGHFFVAFAFAVMARIQVAVDASCVDENLPFGRKLCWATGVSLWWQVVAYLLLTTGEVLFSVSGLQFMYSNVGNLLKPSVAALWLLPAAIGNIFTTLLLSILSSKSQPIFFFSIALLCTLAALLQYMIARWWESQHSSISQERLIGTQNPQSSQRESLEQKVPLRIWVEKDDGLGGDVWQTEKVNVSP